MPASSETQDRDFAISRVFDVPRDRLWKAFTEVEQMKQWWGPKGFTVIAAKLDLRPGGIFHYGLKAPDGMVIWGKFVYREIVAPERLVFISAFSDEKGGLGRHPLAPSWPPQMFSIFSFDEEADGRVRFTVRWSPHEETEEERETFDAGRAGMVQGWSGTMEQLGAYLDKAK